VGQPLPPEILSQADTLERNRRFSVGVRSLRSASATAPSKKVKLTQIGSLLRALQLA